jgi:hypothetical protein
METNFTQVKLRFDWLFYVTINFPNSALTAHIKKSSSITLTFVVAVAQLVRASACGAEGRRFESGQPPHFNGT